MKSTYKRVCVECEVLYKHIEQLEAKLQEASREINQLEKQCYDLESDVEDAYRQLNYED